MPSPFPGMDPWLEGEEIFPNLHNRLIIYLQDELNARLPPEYVATSANRVWVDDEVRRDPDVSVFGPDGKSAGGAWVAEALSRSGLVAVAADPLPEPWEEPYLEIVSAEGRRLVTAVEVLSPANKTPRKKGRGAYLQKQDEFRLSDTNLIEIDLLRGGPHTTAVPLRRLRELPGGYDYHVSYMPAGVTDQFFVSAFRLRDRLPPLTVPLDPGVEPVAVELQPLLDRCYDAGRYAKLVRYDRPPDPPLTPEQAAWADGVLRAAGLRREG